MSVRFDPFLPAGPRWYAIEARRPFLEDLAAGVLDWLGDHPPEALPCLVRRPLHRLMVRNRAGADADDPDRAGSRPAHVRIRVAADRARLVDELRADEGDILPVKVHRRAGAR